MTHTQHTYAPAGAAEPGPEFRVTEIGGVPMSARLAEAPEPRAVVVALHGGATDSGYFDCPGHPELSLLRTAAARGYTVLALDRPGYGRSAPHAADIAAAEHRVDITYEAIDRILGTRPHGAGLFVWSHSAGTELGLRMAADERGRGLLGIEVAGTGLEHFPEVQKVLDAGTGYAAPRGMRELLWAPTDLYPSEIVGGGPIASATPRYEADVRLGWAAHDFRILAAQVRVPVHFTAAEYESVWRSDPESLTAIEGLFTAAPRVAVEVQPGCGHNLSIGFGAPAYHSTVLSFVESCIDMGTRAAKPEPTNDDAAPARHRR
ncbi:alpha/beta fold hydrolase [Rhodococcus sp. DMU1]|uniref:alpha/beta hydrolase n=1 Tax=Rhodococcus sp. DMU1 TaxID=2722825 RepID=UPI00143E3AD7|nr:alpha/beta fold hydrolase [Rhodococcus sp. DMU1]QIX52651.1 alpha/beta hydrolase [Rhodococcus sp. DMU1]